MSLRTRTTSITKSATAESASASTTTDEATTLIVQPQASQASFPQRAISQTLTSTANLANLLPTGTVLSFQLLIPTFTNNGSCDPVTRLMTQLLLLLLASSCFLASFTDSFRSPDGKVYYGFATFKGMWLFDYANSSTTTLPDLSKYKITFVDVVHAVLSVFIFAAIALRDVNVLKCFYPMPEQGTQQFLNIAPVGLGVICSSLFVVFPTRRHGIGYPVSSGN